MLPQATACVLSVAFVPPVVLMLRLFFNPFYLLESSKTILLIYLFLYLAAIKTITFPYFTSPLRHLPNPPGGKAFSGHVRAEFDRPRGSTFRKWVNEVHNSGLILYRGLLQGFPAVLLTTPEAIQEVLVTHAYDYEKPQVGHVLLARTTGRGLVVVEGQEHKIQRKSVAPAFSGKQIRDLVPLFWAKSKEFVDVVANRLHAADGSGGSRTGVIDLSEWTHRVTLDIIGVACVGRDFNSLYNHNDEFVQQYEKILGGEPGNDLIYAALSVVIPPWIGRWLSFHRRFSKASDGRYHLRPLCQKLIEIKRRDMEVESDKHIDILSVLIRSGQFSNEGLVDQLLTFLAAGHETTSGALIWTCWLLSTNSDVQDKLRAELSACFQANAAIDAALLDQLPYLTAVVNEQLRFYPTVPNTTRIAIRDTTILGQHIPKGTNITISPWAINCSKRIWGVDAEKFRPERWLEGDGGVPKSPFSQITFLHGPRSCIGQAFSRAELKCLVAAMVIKFEMRMAEINEVPEPVGLATIKPKNGLRLLLKEL